MEQRTSWSATKWTDLRGATACPTGSHSPQDEPLENCVIPGCVSGSPANRVKLDFEVLEPHAMHFRGKRRGLDAQERGSAVGPVDLASSFGERFEDELAFLLLEILQGNGNASSKEEADRVVREITAGGGRAIAVQANVAKKAHIERLFVESKKAFGPLDILVNNAGI